MALIDDSKSRTARQQLPDSVVSRLRSDDLLLQEKPKEVLLDVFGNVPLKLYDVTLHSIDDIELNSWSPSLHLTDEERDVVEAEGTVLVLGRSGTGKVSDVQMKFISQAHALIHSKSLFLLVQTVCICNRMEYDRQKYGRDPTFSQLFVARSKRLCRYVSEAVGSNDTSTFETFEDLVRYIDAELPHLEKGGVHFFPSQRIDFRRFKQEFASSSNENEISALTLWTGELMM